MNNGSGSGWRAAAAGLLALGVFSARAQHEMPEFIELPAAETAAAETAAVETAVMEPVAVEAVTEPVVVEALEQPAPAVGPERAEPERKLPEIQQPAASAGAVDLAAYEEVLNENLALRRKIEESSRTEEAIRRENEKLAGELRLMERKMQELSAAIDDLNKQKQAAPPQDTERLANLEAQVAAAEAEKAKLNQELTDLRRRAEQRATPAAAAALPPPPERTVRPDSDLFKKLEQENLLLKQRLDEVEAERQKAVRETERAAEIKARQKELEKQLAEARKGQEQERRRVQKLLEKIPDIEKELTSLESQATSKDSALATREKDLETLRLELERRENRLIKAERMTALLEKTREDLRQVSEKEKRDLHYNMAAVYAKEGRYREAEQEYLQALRVDPADADTHYNLAILYDDELQDKRRAAMHYRRYLKLRPNAPDVDAVKNWLMELEMSGR